MKATFEHDGTKYEAELRQNDWREKATKARAYVWGPGDDRSPSKEFQALADHLGAPSVYTERGEYPALDKAFRKMNREIVDAKRACLEAALVALDQPVDKISFSRNAGCSCGCSPGFVLDGPYRKTLFIKVAEGETKAA